MKAYKGFNKDMTCRGFQFEEGQKYHEENAETCVTGFHACENPLDCFTYYKPGTSVYHEVEIEEVCEARSSDDSKVCGKTIKIGARLDAREICSLHFDYVKKHATGEEQGGNDESFSAQDCSSLAAQDCSSLAAQDYSSLAAQDCSSLAAQDYSSLAAQDYSSLAAQDYSSLAAQDCSNLAAGKNSVIAAFNSRAKGDIGTLIALANRETRDGEYVITDFKAAIVDGEAVKADTWYKLENGEFVECTEGAK